MQIQAYLCFNGRCEEAIDFYCEALGANVLMKSYFKDMPDSETCPSGAEDKVMHAALQIGESVLLEMTQIGKVCHDRCAIYHQAGDCVMPREGVFAIVLEGGPVKTGDSVEILDPVVAESPQ